MPLLSPSQIHAVLRQELPANAGGAKVTRQQDKLDKLLENANLSKEEVLENLSSLLRSGETDGVRLRAAETALRLNGLLQSESERADFSVTINILDSDFSVNPILFPRETSPNT